MSQKKRTFSSTIDELAKIEPNKKTLTVPSPSPALPPSFPDPSLNAAPIPTGSLSQQRKRPTFPSYSEIPTLPPKTKLICEILVNSPLAGIETSLTDTGIRITPEDVEEVLKLTYGSPGAAVKFFRWAGWQLGDKHSPYAWNLMVDLLGKNLLFDAMWGAVKSMKNERFLSLATFASVFSSYVTADRVNDALMTFEVLELYGCPRDVVALNSLLSAICRDGQTLKAQEFFDRVKEKIRPDSDTFAILLEGWENESNVLKARQTFGEMVFRVGWDLSNVPAYDSFLNTLIRGLGLDEAMKFLNVMKEKKCLPGMKFFRSALEMSFKHNNVRDATALWEVMVRHGFIPNTFMYNSMIGLLCYTNQIDTAFRFFDEMIFNGAFPDSQTYNLMLQFLLKNKKLRDAMYVFNEMVKNECWAGQATCALAMKSCLDYDDPDMALKVWKHMVENNISPNEENGNLLILRLRDLNRLSEARKYAEDMIERGIKVNSSTMSKLKHALNKARKGDLFETLQMKWKSH